MCLHDDVLSSANASGGIEHVFMVYYSRQSLR